MIKQIELVNQKASGSLQVDVCLQSETKKEEKEILKKIENIVILFGRLLSQLAVSFVVPIRISVEQMHRVN